jgi:hypothetical protein
MPTTAQIKYGCPESFPDPATCRVERSCFEDLFDCVSTWVNSCPYSLRYGNSQTGLSYFCHHPSAPEILERWKQKRI